MIFNPFKKNEIAKYLPEVRGTYKYNVSMKKHTRFGVGGEAEVVFLPKDIDDLRTFIRNKPRNMPIFVLGGGSNVLVRDGGIIGAVIKLSSPFFSKYEINGNSLMCYAGMNNHKLLDIMCEHQLSGLEFLCTIPGTIGGAIRSNASCFGYSISDFFESALIVDGEGEIKIVEAGDFKFGYRSSLFPEDWIVLAVIFKLKPGEKQEVKNKVKEYEEYRKAHQPYDKRTAGSFFKNPDGLKAWELIKKAGCNNLKCGDAQVSPFHCNFIINNGNATAENIERLADEIIKKVKEKTFITLEPEVKKVGVRK